MKKFGIAVLVVGILVMIALGAFQNSVYSNETLQRVNRQSRSTLTMTPDYAGKLVSTESARSNLRCSLQAAGVSFENVEGYVTAIRLYSAAPVLTAMSGLVAAIGLVLFFRGYRRTSFQYLVMM